MKPCKRILQGLVLLLVIGFLVPGHPVIPVKGATPRDWHPQSFWFEPWGKSGVHKGIDVFAARHAPVVSSVPGIVLYEGQLGMGGKVIAILGPKWRVYYYAHLEDARSGVVVRQGQVIGSVGTSGNAAGKPPHLHFAVLSIVPLPWRISADTQGWKKMFFLDPAALLTGA